MCGDTKIPAGGMKRAMERLSQIEEQTGQNGYHAQFKVKNIAVHCNFGCSSNFLIKKAECV